MVVGTFLSQQKHIPRLITHFSCVLGPQIVQLEIDGHILAWLGGYVWDLGLLDDGVVHGGASTCTPLDWLERHSTHVRRFALANTINMNTLTRLICVTTRQGWSSKSYMRFWSVLLLPLLVKRAVRTSNAVPSGALQSTAQDAAFALN